MRFKTLVLTTLFAVLAGIVHQVNVQPVSLPESQSQTSANAPQDNQALMQLRLDQYLNSRQYITASRNQIRQGSNIISIGEKYLGVSYCKGGTSPRCFDCSGFTQYVYRNVGIDIPRVAGSQLNSLNTVKRSEAQEGDLVFFLSKGGYVYHVGIYVGNNTILHSPKPGRKVRYETIWSSRVVFARQL